MKNLNCPQLSCKNPSKVVKRGRFYRKSDARYIQRFYCKTCKCHFSRATFDPAYRQNKRRVNNSLMKLLASGVSGRRSAFILGVNRKTIARKLIYLGKLCEEKNKKYLKKYREVNSLEFDDLQTIEHTKCKPLSVTLAVEVGTRKMLGFKVSSMPATGHLAKIARKKYGFRKDDRQKGIVSLFREISPLISPSASILSDQHPFYPPQVKKFFPHATYDRVKGARGCIAGQGELKKLKFDPLYSLNHTCAMLRANINRLIRKTWCTTKKPERLVDHLNIYMYFHNTIFTD